MTDVMAATSKFLNHQQIISEMYVNCVDLRDCLAKNCTKDHPTISYEMKKIFFDVCVPYLMDSQAVAMVCNGEAARKCRKRKRNKLGSTNYHSEVRQMVEKYLETTNVISGEPTSNEILLNNLFVRTACQVIDDDCTLADMCYSNIKEKQEKITIGCHRKINLVNKLTRNKSKSACIIKWRNEDYLIPAQSCFILSNDVFILTNFSCKFDVILIDPPWNNKSIKRKKCYDTRSEEEFFKLPVKELSKDDALIGVWTTNNDRLINYVKGELFAHWGIQHLTDWHWLKVTRYGKPVVPLDHATKKPYENLIWGQKLVNKKYIIEQNVIFASVPSGFHSHKPIIKDLLKDIIPNRAKCLEIFSRSLTTGWTSFGNEVLKFQRVELFNQTTCK